jgi:hypothetical protein
MVAPLILAAALMLAPQAPEVIVEIRVHGNAVMPEEEVRRLAGVQPGTPVESGTIAAVEERLLASGRFSGVQVLKRFASIADPSKIILVIVVDEGQVRIEWDRKSGEAPRTVRRRGPPLLFLPVLDAEDGYGLTYGIRLAWPGAAGPRSRLALPLTWGGDKRAAAQLEKDFDTGPVDRVTGGAAISRREHPFFEQDEDRARVWVRGERDLLPDLRVSATLGSERVSFMEMNHRYVQAGGDVVFDTRLDPMLARNAVYARAAWDHLAFRGGEAINRHELAIAGYLGLVGQSVVVAYAQRTSADGPLPSYLKPVLGGMANLRGLRAGTAVGDTRVSGTVELRLPISSPLNIARFGLTAFVDAGTVYDHGGRLANQRLEKGVGGGVWVSAAFVRFHLAVAHGIGRSTRAHIGTSLSF